MSAGTEPGLVSAIIGSLVGGGLIGTTGSYYLNRKKLPAEISQIAVTGAESAVMALEKALNSETKRADRAEEKNRVYESQIEALQNKLEDAQRALDELRRELTDLVATTHDHK